MGTRGLRLAGETVSERVAISSAPDVRERVPDRFCGPRAGDALGDARMLQRSLQQFLPDSSSLKGVLIGAGSLVLLIVMCMALCAALTCCRLRRGWGGRATSAVHDCDKVCRVASPVSA